MSHDQIIQRSEFQFRVFIFNLVAVGALFAFALNPVYDFKYVLCVIPGVSFILFIFWLHQAFAILSAKDKGSGKKYGTLRKFTYFIAICANFIIAPFSSLILSYYYNYFIKMPYAVINYINILVMAFSMVLFVIWFCSQYYCKK